MASLQSNIILSLLLLHSIILLNHTAKSDDEEDSLLQGINSYRTGFNLTALSKNDKAECLADELADQFKNQPCTNTTGINTVPGTEPQFPNFPNMLAKCQLNVTTTRDGVILPACVPNLVPSIVLTNFTQTEYSNYLNDTKFTGAGIGSDNNWIVLILTTDTPEGNYMTGTTSGNSVFKVGVNFGLVFLLMGSFLLF
ncbi:hypothetical protein LguiA_001589 [Lonicera macranthoides]